MKTIILRYLLLVTCIVLIFLIYHRQKEQESGACIEGAFLFGLPAFGKPLKRMGGVIEFITDTHAKTGVWPEGGQLPVSAGELFFYYTKTPEDFQLAWWSGETAWVYVFSTNTYYETREDISRFGWYDPEKGAFLGFEDAAAQGKQVVRLR